jgi:hypothetical protein
VMGKTRRGLDEREKRCVALATEDREGSGAPVKSKRGEAGKAAYPELGYSNGVVDEVRGSMVALWMGCSGLRCCDAHARARRSNGDGGAALALLLHAR